MGMAGGRACTQRNCDRAETSVWFSKEARHSFVEAKTTGDHIQMQKSTTGGPPSEMQHRVRQGKGRGHGCIVVRAH